MLGWWNGPPTIFFCGSVFVCSLFWVRINVLRVRFLWENLFANCLNTHVQYRLVGTFFLRGGSTQRRDGVSVRQECKPLWESGGMPHGKFWKLGCLIMHFVRFEGSMMWKQAAESKLKNVDITQTFKLQNGFFLAQRLVYVLEDVTI